MRNRAYLPQILAVSCALSALAMTGCDDTGGGGDPGGTTSSNGGSNTGGNATGGGNIGGNATGGGNTGGGNTGGNATGGSSVGGGNTGGAGTGGNTPEPGWGESDPGVTKGPIGHFKAFHAGCGDQLWMRFIPGADFALGKLNANASNGAGLQITYFESPVFLEDEKSVYLIDDQENWDAASATLGLTVQNPDQSILTHSFDVPLDPLFRWPGQIDYDSAHMDSFDGLQLTINPNISGNVIRMFLYDLDTECSVYSKTFLDDGQVITKGTLTEINVGATNLTPGKDYLMVLQGVDTARDYIYYATLELPAP